MINKPIKIGYFVHKNIIKNIINKFFIEIMIIIKTISNRIIIFTNLIYFLNQNQK